MQVIAMVIHFVPIERKPAPFNRFPSCTAVPARHRRFSIQPSL
jgi:hypothetical protein